MGLTRKSCYTNRDQPAPNPDPSRWVLLDKAVHPGGFVLEVRYTDCTNFEGRKIMVFRGAYQLPAYLDPHFQDGGDGPVARFRPDSQGWDYANALAAAFPSMEECPK